MWQTVGRMPSACRARIPPMPSTISCWMRNSRSPAVQRARHSPVLRRVFFNIGIQQVKRNSSHARFPDLGGQTPARKIDFHRQRFPLRIFRRFNREGMEIVDRVLSPAAIRRR